MDPITPITPFASYNQQEYDANRVIDQQAAQQDFILQQQQEQKARDRQVAEAEQLQRAQVAAAKRGGVRTQVDETGQERMQLHEDGAPVYEPGFVTGPEQTDAGAAVQYRDPRGNRYQVPLDAVRTTTDPTGERYYEFDLPDAGGNVSTVRQPEGSRPLFKTDPNTGMRYTEAPDMQTGSMAPVPLGLDPQAAAQAAIQKRKEAEIRQQQERSYKADALRLEQNIQETQLKPVKDRLSAAEKAYNDLAKGKERYRKDAVKGLLSIQTVGGEDVEIPIPDTDAAAISKAQSWLQTLDRTAAELKAAKDEHDPLAQTVFQQQQQRDALALQALKEGRRAQMELRAMEEAAKRGVAVYEPDWKKRALSILKDERALDVETLAALEETNPDLAQQAEKIQRKGGEAAVQPASGEVQNSPADPISQAPETPEEVAASALDTITSGLMQGGPSAVPADIATAKNLALKTLGVQNPASINLVPDEYGNFDLVRADPAMAKEAPLGFFDPKANAIYLHPPRGIGENSDQRNQAMAEEALAITQNARTGGVPVYFAGGSGVPYKPAELREMIRAGIEAATNAKTPEEAEVKLEQAGLSSAGLKQKMLDGRLSVQDAKLLNEKFNGADETKMTRPEVDAGLQKYLASSPVEAAAFKNGQQAEVIGRYMDQVGRKASANLVLDRRVLAKRRAELLAPYEQGTVGKVADFTKETVIPWAGMLAQGAAILPQEAMHLLGMETESGRLSNQQFADWRKRAAGVIDRMTNRSEVTSALSPLQEWAQTAEPGEQPPDELAEKIAKVVFENYHELNTETGAKLDTSPDTFNINKDPMLKAALQRYLTTADPAALEQMKGMMMLDARDRKTQAEVAAYVEAPRAASPEIVVDRAKALGLTLDASRARAALALSVKMETAQSPEAAQTLLKQAQEVLGTTTPEDTMLAMSLATRQETDDPDSAWGMLKGGFVAGRQEAVIEVAMTALEAGATVLSSGVATPAVVAERTARQGIKTAIRRAVSRNVRAALDKVADHSTRFARARTALSGARKTISEQVAKTADEWGKLGMQTPKFGQPLTRGQKAANLAVGTAKTAAASAPMEGIEEGIAAIGEPDPTPAGIAGQMLTGAAGALVLAPIFSGVNAARQVWTSRAGVKEWETKKATYIQELNKRMAGQPGFQDLTTEDFDAWQGLQDSPAHQQARNEHQAALTELETAIAQDPAQADEPVSPTVLAARARVDAAAQHMGGLSEQAFMAMDELRGLPAAERPLYTATAKAAAGVRDFTEAEAKALMQQSGANAVVFRDAALINTPMPSGMENVSGAVGGKPVKGGRQLKALAELPDVTPVAPGVYRLPENARIDLPEPLVALLAERAPSMVALMNRPQAAATPAADLGMTPEPAAAQRPAAQPAVAAVPLVDVGAGTPPTPATSVMPPPAVAPAALPPEARDNLARQVVGTVLARSPKLRSLVREVADPLNTPSGGMWTDEEGVKIHFPTLVEQLAQAPDGQTAARRVEAVLDEEIRHAANLEAAKRLWKKGDTNPLQLSFTEWRDAWYSDIWENQFTAEMRAQVEAAYGDTLPSEPWRRAMEGLRMLDQLRATNSITEAVLRALEEVVQVLREFLALVREGARPAIQAEINGIRAMLAEFGYEDGKVKPAKAKRKPAARQANPQAPVTSTVAETSMPAVEQAPASAATPASTEARVSAQTQAMAREAFQGLFSAPGSQAQDTAYMAAVESGDMAKAQSMVDEAAKAAGYTIRAFHGLNYGGSQSLEGDAFDFSRGRYGYGVWVSDSENVGRRYGKKNMLGLYLNPGQVFTQQDYAKLAADDPLRQQLAAVNYNADSLSTVIDFSGAEPLLKRMGYAAIAHTRPQSMDGVKVGDGEHTAYFVFGSPSQVKSADPVTYDANGQPIPLSQRFDPADDSILYSAPVLPLEQKAIPVERMPAFINLAQALVAEGVNTPDALARFLDQTFEGGQARPFSQALWNALGMVNPALSSTPDWAAVYAKQAQKAPQSPPATATESPPPAAESIVSAEGKVEDQVTAIAATQGQRDAKDIKADITAALQKALRERDPGNPKSVTFQIPGDGKFTILDSAENIEGLLKRVKRLPTDIRPTNAPAPNGGASLPAMANAIVKAGAAGDIDSWVTNALNGDEWSIRVVAAVRAKSADLVARAEARVKDAVMLQEANGVIDKSTPLPQDFNNEGADSPSNLAAYEELPDSDLDREQRAAVATLRDHFGPGVFAVTPRMPLLSPRETPRQSESRRGALNSFGELTRALRQVFGKKVLFARRRGRPLPDNGYNLGSARNVLVVDIDATEPVLYLVGHELGHAMAAQAPDLYRRLSDAVRPMLGDVEGYRERLRQLGYPEDELEAEIINDFIGSQFLEKPFWQTLADANKGLFESVAAFAVRFLDAITGRTAGLSRDVRPLFNDIQGARTALAGLLAEFAQRGDFPAQGAITGSTDLSRNRAQAIIRNLTPKEQAGKLTPPEIAIIEEARRSLAGDSSLASAPGISQSPAMASDSGAAQNAEPSPGGLSEAEESIKRSLPSDLSLEYGKLGKDVAILWRNEQSFPAVADVRIIGGDASGKSVSSYPTAAVYLDNGGVFLKRFRVSNHDQVSQSAFRHYDLDYRLTQRRGESDAEFDQRVLVVAEPDLVNAARFEWEQQMEALRPLVDSAYAQELAARKAQSSLQSTARLQQDDIARFFKDKTALPAKRYSNRYGLVFQDGVLSDGNGAELGRFQSLDEARYWARDNWQPSPESSRETRKSAPPGSRNPSQEGTASVNQRPLQTQRLAQEENQLSTGPVNPESSRAADGALASAPEVDADKSAKQQRVREILDSMPQIWREVLKAQASGQSIAQIAAARNIPEEAVQNVLRQATGRFRILMAKDAAVKPKVRVESGAVKATSGRPDLAMSGIPAVVAVDQRRMTPEEVTHAEMQEMANRMFEVDAAAAERLVTRWMDSGTTVLSTDGVPDAIKAVVDAAQAKQAAEMLMTAAAKLLVSREMLASGDSVRLARLINLYRETGTEQARALNMRRDPQHTPEERAAMYLAEALLTPPPSVRNEMRRNPGNRDKILAAWAVEADQIKKEMLAEGIDLAATFREMEKEQKLAAEAVPPEVRLPLARASAATRNLVKAVLEGKSWGEAAAAGKMTLEAARKAYLDFRQTINTAAAQAAAQAKEALLSSAPAADYAAQLGLPDWLENAAPDFVPVKTEVTRKLKAQRERKKVGGEIDLRDPVSVKRAAQAVEMRKATTFDKVSEYWRASILSGPQTHVVNIVSGLTYGAYETFVKKAAAGLQGDILRMFGMKADAASLADLPAMMAGTMPAVKKAFADAIRSWKAESPLFESYALQTDRSNEGLVKGERDFKPALQGVLGKVMRGVSFRLMTAADEFVKSFITRVEVAAQARQIARSEGKTGIEMAQAINDMMEPGSLAWVRAFDQAKKVTFTTEIGSGRAAIDSLDGVAKLVQKSKKGDFGSLVKAVSHFVVPFVDTPVNIFKAGVTMSPVGGLLAVIDAARAFNRMRKGNVEDAQKIYNAARALDDITNQIVAWGFIIGLSSLVKPGEDDNEMPFITGTMEWRSTAPGERELAYRVAPPQSIRIGGQWYSYKRLDPFASALAFTVDAIKSFKAGEPLEKAWAKVGLNMLRNMQDKTFLQGISDLVNAFSDPERFGSRWATGIATGFIPNLIRQPIRTADPLIRENDLPNDMGFWEALGRRAGYGMIPQLAPPAVDVWGRETLKNTGTGGPNTDWMLRLLSPADMKDADSPDPLDVALMRYNLTHDDHFGVTAPSREIQRTVAGKPLKISLNDEEYLDFVTKAGQAARDAIGGRYNDRVLDEDDVKAIKKVISSANDMFRDAAFARAVKARGGVASLLMAARP